MFIGSLDPTSGPTRAANLDLYPNDPLVSPDLLIFATSRVHHLGSRQSVFIQFMLSVSTEMAQFWSEPLKLDRRVVGFRLLAERVEPRKPSD